MKCLKPMAILIMALTGFVAEPCVSKNCRAANPLDQAKQASEELVHWEDKVVGLLETIQKRLEETRPSSVMEFDRAASLSDFKEVLGELRVPATWLMENRPGFEESLSAYGAAIGKAGPAMDKAAQTYYSLSKKYPEDHVLRQHYVILGNHAREAVASLNDRAAALDTHRKELAVQLAFVQESLVYLDHLEFFLDIYPASSDSARRIEYYLSQLNAFIEHFEATVSLFQNFSQGLAKPAEAPQAESSP